MNSLRGFRAVSWILLAVFPLAAQAQQQLSERHVGRVSDWSSRHLVVSGGLSAANLEVARTEPRILFHLADRNLERVQRGLPPLPFASEDPENRRVPMPPNRSRIVDGTSVNEMNTRSLKKDWSVSLGTGSVAQSKYPAKFTFDINATPSCANDFVVYGLNVAGATGGQANIVGLNNLYSGTAANGGTFCPGHTTATVTWAYNGSTAGGRVRTSPSISMDGTKIAYVESAGASSIFHVLTVRAGQGAVTGAAAPTANGSCVGGTPPATSCLKSVTYSTTTTTTLADPWVDYQTDKAFVASDDGKIYRISCVFTCGLNAQPTVDWSFTLPVAGTGGARPVPNGPVYDYPSGRLFIGDQLGELWVINAGGTTPTLYAGPVMIGGGGCTTAHPPGRTGTGADCTATGTAYGIPDSIVLDASGASQRIYAFSGNGFATGSTTLSAVVAQLTMSLTQEVSVAVGQGGVNLYSGAFNNDYWGATPAASGELFLCGTGPANTNPYHYWIGFTSYPVMNSAPTGSLQRIAAAGIPCVPYTELYNPNINLRGVAGDHDLLMSGLVAARPNGYMTTDDISSGAPVAVHAIAYPGGVSGIIIDNVSTDVQASSMYFATLTGRRAIKLTQLNSN